jgi:microcystin-dependent protein
VETVALSEAQLPNHTHDMLASTENADLQGPGNNDRALARAVVYHAPTNLTPMASAALPSAGGNQPHNNMQPYLALNYIIALVGLYPSRS